MIPEKDTHPILGRLLALALKVPEWAIGRLERLVDELTEPDDRGR